VHVDGALPRTVVEVEQHDLLPRAEDQATRDHGMASEGPMIAARMCACEFVSWLSRLWA
jgi:hypothetical protein